MSHSTLLRRLSGGLLAALVFACAFAPRADARRAKAFDFAELDKVIEAELKAGHTPGAAVAVVSGDRVI
jgi:CubicO group peptidase (beta-lactamase class C family)